MHELSIATALVGQIEELLEKEENGSLVSFTLEIGELSGVESDALEFVLPLVLESSPFPDAKFIIHRVDAEITCRNCGRTAAPKEKFVFFCPHCQSDEVTICKGKNIMIKSMELSCE